MSTQTDVRPLSLATRLKVARVGAGLDQKDLAQTLGVSRGTISNWERGASEPPLGLAVALAQATGVTLDWLAEGINEKAPADETAGADESRLSDLNRRPVLYEGTALPLS